MTFNSGTFMIAGTAIAIAGVALYLWDTRGSPLLSSSSAPAPAPNPSYTSNNNYSGYGGKSRKHKKNQNKKTKKR